MAGDISQDLASCQFVFLLDQNSNDASVGLTDAGSRTRAKGPLERRAVEVRASGAVGLGLASGFSVAQIVWNRSTRRAGARGGARVGRPRWLRILMITGGSSMAAIIFKAPPQSGQCSMSTSKTRLSSRAPADAPVS